jgi:hypothetical protein
MSPPTSLASTPHFSVWFVNGLTHVFVVAPRLAVKSPGLLVMVTEVVAVGAEFVAANVPFVHGVV